MANLADRFSRLSALKPVRTSAPFKPSALRLPDETDPISLLLGGGIARNKYGEHLAIRNWFSTPEFAPPSSAALELLLRSPNENLGRRNRGILEDPEKWLFLDTETTGLAGGTGTYAFLVGLAWWDSGGLQVEQLFLRDLHEEYSLLQELATRLAERPVLVTFNGKTFDWPLLENRFTMTRTIRVPPLTAHLDLLHPARTLWKLRLGTVRLVDLERHVLDPTRLGWKREDDVPSAMIPQYYFEYLRGVPGQPLAGVVKHNQMDLRGLAALFGKINSLLESRENGFGEADSLDLIGLSKFFHRKGEQELAHFACASALEAGLPEEFRPGATRELAQMAKRRGEAQRAAELWHRLVTDPQETVVACEQLAIHYERNHRDFVRALEFAQLGMKMLRSGFCGSRYRYGSSRHARQMQRFMCRVDRLQHRIRSEKNASSTPLLTRNTVMDDVQEKSAEFR